MTYHFEFEFDDLQIWPDLDVFANGKAAISYEWEPADPSTGYRGGPTDVEVESVSVGFTHAHFLEIITDAITEALENSESVVEACVAHYEKRDR